MSSRCTSLRCFEIHGPRRIVRLGRPNNFKLFWIALHTGAFSTWNYKLSYRFPIRHFWLLTYARRHNKCEEAFLIIKRIYNYDMSNCQTLILSVATTIDRMNHVNIFGVGEQLNNGNLFILRKHHNGHQLNLVENIQVY